MIRIQRLFGSESGLQTTHGEQRITFGRVPGNTVVLDHPNLSRQHGEIVLHDEQWYLVNRSANGTTINGKVVTGDQPIALKPGDTIGVGKQKLLNVQFQPAARAGAAAEEPDPEVGPKRELSRRAKLWIAIGGYVFVMLVIGVVLWGLRDDDARSREAPPQLTDQQIAAEIRRPLERSPSEREAAYHLSEARQWYPRTDGHEAGLYHTHRHYKLALAFSGRSHFEDEAIEQLQFENVERALIQKITKEYRDAYARLRSREWSTAEQRLRELLKAYPDPDSVIWQNVSDQLQVVIANRPKGRSFR